MFIVLNTITDNNNYFESFCQQKQYLDLHLLILFEIMITLKSYELQFTRIIILKNIKQ
jgi:hypothetical protein